MQEAVNQTGGSITVNMDYTSEFVTASFSETYTRVALADLIANQVALRCSPTIANILVPYLDRLQYVLVGTFQNIEADTQGVNLPRCCCPCHVILNWRGRDYEDLPVVGEINDGVNPPIDLYGQVTSLTLQTRYCRPTIIHPDYLFDPTTSEETTPVVTMDVAGGVLLPTGLTSAEQTVIFGSEDFITGSAQLSWTPPESGAEDIVFEIQIADIAPNQQLQPGWGFNVVGSVDSALRITRETNGVRVSFIGKWGKQAVNDIVVLSNSVVSHPAQTASNGSVSLSFELYTMGEEGLEPYLQVNAGYTITGTCPDGFPGDYNLETESTTVDVAVTW